MANLNLPFNQQVIEDKIDSILMTNLDANQFATVDNTLTTNEGMTKTIHKYVASGQADRLAKTQGNSHSISATATTEDYTVQALQGHTSWYDEDVMTDPTYIDTLVRGVADVMTNQNTADIFGEMAKATLYTTLGTSWFDTIVDAIYTYPYEDKSGLYIVVPTLLIPAIIKDAGTKLQYVEDFYRTGAVGAIAGVPLYSTKAIAYDPSTVAEGDKIGFVGKRDAITNFMKKGLETETDRNPDIRKNDYWARKYNVVALTDATKVVAIKQGA